MKGKVDLNVIFKFLVVVFKSFTVSVSYPSFKIFHNVGGYAVM